MVKIIIFGRPVPPRSVQVGSVSRSAQVSPASQSVQVG